jgi:siroheme decarboxylase
MAAVEPAGNGPGHAARSQQPDDTGAVPPDDAGAARASEARRRARGKPASEAGRRAGRVPVPKLRTRKHGAAVPLDELDKRLLNLMQGAFPIAARPYAHVAAQAGIAEQDAIARVRHLIEQRIIRQVTPIYDTRALGYSSMLVAAKVDPENPWRAATVINGHPGVSHNYLRSHEFNIWFTIATEPDSPLGVEGTLEVLARLAGADSIRQLPTLKLFKIRMDLEMEGDTAALASAVEVAPPAETERQPYDELDVDVIRATQGDMQVTEEPYAPAAARLGMEPDDLLAHLRGMQERRLLRRVAAILFHRRAGFSANGMGVWKVPDERIMELGPKMAAFRGISHCYQRPTYKDWPYSIFTMAHGRSKQECDAILDSIAAQTGIGDRATLYSSTEFKKVRLLYFTPDYRAWEREHAGV